MRQDELLKAVQERAQIDRDGAERATKATLTALAERLEEGEATDFASQLPQELKGVVQGADGGTGEPIDLNRSSWSTGPQLREATSSPPSVVDGRRSPVEL